MTDSIVLTVKRCGFPLVALLVATAFVGSVARAQAVVEIRAVAAPAFEPAPAAPADPAPAPAQAPARGVARLTGIMPLVPSPAIVAPAPINHVFSVLNPAALAKAGVFRGNSAVLIAAPFPNPFLYGLHLFSVTRQEIALANVKLARQRAAKRVAVARPQLAQLGIAAGNNGVEAQMRKMLEPMLKSEVSFAARVMDLNAQEKKTFVRESKKSFDKFVGDYVKKQDPNQQQMMLQGAQAIFFGNQERPESPRDIIRREMAKLVAATFSKEKNAAYASECRKREEFAHQVAVDNLVERLDERVKLSPDQWKKITKSLNEHWDKKKGPQLEAFLYNSNMWPGAPDQWVLPELTAAQKNVIKRINTMSGQVFFGGGMLGNFMGGDADVIDDVDIEVNAQGEANPFAP
jgi:hypothetical protein